MIMDEAALMSFSWVHERRLAACRGPRTQRDLAFLVHLGIKVLVRLAHEEETGMTADEVAAAGLRDYYEPFRDFTPPSQEQLDRVTSAITDCLINDEPVAVSCKAGYGRTGTVLACVLVTTGLSADDAIERLIEQRPVAKEILHVPGQVAAIHEFARRRIR